MASRAPRPAFSYEDTVRGRTRADADIQKLYPAITRGDLNEVLRCVHSYGTYNIRDSNGLTLFHKFVIASQTDMIHIFARRDQDLVAAPDKHGFTPLHHAVLHSANNDVIAALALNCPAILDKATPDGVTPMYTAVQTRQPRIITLLLKLGSKACDELNAHGYTPRTYAKEQRFDDCLKAMTPTQEINA